MEPIWRRLAARATELVCRPRELPMWTNEPDLHIVVDGCHIRGKEYKLPASTTDLDKAKFGEYLEKICALTNVPLPDPEAAGYISNYDKPKT